MDPQQVLSQYLAGIGGQAPILALPKSSSLLVTQSADVLRKLVKMVEQSRRRAGQEVTSAFIKLERADARSWPSGMPKVASLRETDQKHRHPAQSGEYAA